MLDNILEIGTDGTFVQTYDATFETILNEDSNESVHSAPRMRSICDWRIRIDFLSSSRLSVRFSIVRFNSTISAISCSLPLAFDIESMCSIISGVDEVLTLSHLMESVIMFQKISSFQTK
jgi:hypothetical protein